jgi:hypothetical protein
MLGNKGASKAAEVRKIAETIAGDEAAPARYIHRLFPQGRYFERRRGFHLSLARANRFW